MDFQKINKINKLKAFNVVLWNWRESNENKKDKFEIKTFLVIFDSNKRYMIGLIKNWINE